MEEVGPRRSLPKREQVQSPPLSGSPVPVAANDVPTRMAHLEALVEKRTMNLDYLRKIHNDARKKGGAFWLNTMFISSQLLQEYVATEVPKSRPLQFYQLGLSLAKLLDQPPTPTLIRALAQMFEEFEYHYSSSAVQTMKFMMAKPSEFLYPELSPEPPEEPIAPRMYKHNNDVAYENFYAVPVPFSLDYIEVLDSLCYVLSMIYYKLQVQDAESLYSNQSVFEALVKVDAKVKHHIINPISRELTELSLRVMRDELDWLRLTGDGGGRL